MLEQGRTFDVVVGEEASNIFLLPKVSPDEKCTRIYNDIGLPGFPINEQRHLPSGELKINADYVPW